MEGANGVREWCIWYRVSDAHRRLPLLFVHMVGSASHATTSAPYHNAHLANTIGSHCYRRGVYGTGGVRVSVYLRSLFIII